MGEWIPDDTNLWTHVDSGSESYLLTNVNGSYQRTHILGDDSIGVTENGRVCFCRLVWGSVY